MPRLNLEDALRAAIAHHRAGRLRDAEALYRELLAVQPRHPDALHLLGVLAGQCGRLGDAAELIGQAVALAPNHPAYYSNLGNFLQQLGRLDEALAALQKAIALNPRLAEAHNNLGNTLREKGRLDEALASIQQALVLHGDYAEAHYNLGNVWKDKGAFDGAIACYQTAISLNPDLSPAHNNLGNLYKMKQQLESATACFERALSLNPSYADAHNNLGAALKDKGDLDGAIAHFRQALALNPQFISARDNLLLVLHYHPGSDSQTLLAESRLWDSAHAAALRSFIAPHANDPEPKRRLRIGYVSSDFREHVSAHFLAPLLASHQHKDFEIFGYSHVLQPDATTERLKSSADHWRSTIELSDAQLAQVIRQDKIDILVDLKLHTEGNRLLVFARKPAPIQVTWLGYPGTTGLSTIDYRLTDPYLDPHLGPPLQTPAAGNDFYTEKSVYLPHTYWCYDPLTDQPAPNAPPHQTVGYITFGCLNNFCKLNGGLFDLWVKIMLAVPHSRLLLLAPEGSCRQRALDHFRREGLVDLERIVWVRGQSRQDYLRQYHLVDICLDTVPYNGHTTSLDSLWMGVPIVTLRGRTAVGRAGVTFLSNLGLPELIAQTPEEYVQIAVDLAHDFPRIAEFRAMLRGRMQSSPLMNAALFARNVEDAYRKMWLEWCDARGKSFSDRSAL